MFRPWNKLVCCGLQDTLPYTSPFQTDLEQWYALPDLTKLFFFLIILSGAAHMGVSKLRRIKRIRRIQRILILRKIVISKVRRISIIFFHREFWSNSIRRIRRILILRKIVISFRRILILRKIVISKLRRISIFFFHRKF